ncbi:MAG: molybdopterin-dependent oxidoreductase [Pseudomonadota bacterium]
MLRVLLVCCLLALPFAAQAEAKSPVVLTVAGKVDMPNRGALDQARDGLMARLVEPFEQARGFTLADLAALPQEGVTLQYSNWDQPISFVGPSLESVLKAAGATGNKLQVMALDGYAAEFTQEMITGKTFILALEADATALAVGERGPLWLVFPPGEAAPAYPGDDDAGLVWAVFFIGTQD